MNNKGFSLTEITITMLISGVLAIVMSTLVTNQQKSQKKIITKQEIEESFLIAERYVTSTTARCNAVTSHLLDDNQNPKKIASPKHTYLSEGMKINKQSTVSSISLNQDLENSSINIEFLNKRGSTTFKKIFIALNNNGECINIHDNENVTTSGCESVGLSKSDASEDCLNIEDMKKVEHLIDNTEITEGPQIILPEASKDYVSSVLDESQNVKTVLESTSSATTIAKKLGIKTPPPNYKKLLCIKLGGKLKNNSSSKNFCSPASGKYKINSVLGVPYGIPSIEVICNKTGTCDMTKEEFNSAVSTYLKKVKRGTDCESNYMDTSSYTTKSSKAVRLVNHNIPICKKTISIDKSDHLTPYSCGTGWKPYFKNNDPNISIYQGTNKREKVFDKFKNIASLLTVGYSTTVQVNYLLSNSSNGSAAQKTLSSKNDNIASVIAKTSPVLYNANLVRFSKGQTPLTNVNLAAGYSRNDWPANSTTFYIFDNLYTSTSETSKKRCKHYKRKSGKHYWPSQSSSPTPREVRSTSKKTRIYGTIHWFFMSKVTSIGCF